MQIDNRTNRKVIMDSNTIQSDKKQKRKINLPNDIKCVILHGFGSIKQMKTISIPRPSPGDSEALVHIKSCGVNFLDLSIRQGQFNNLPKLPFVPGFECAGEIVQLGPNTSGFSVNMFILLTNTSLLENNQSNFQLDWR